jgi:POT family proton-dependent oligopeptide transporter
MAGDASLAQAGVTPPRGRTWLGQPPGLAILFLTEMWEKFSFFGMQVLQVYYMTKALHFDQARASLVYGGYAACVYLTPIAGGVISDRWLGKRRAVIVGGLLMALGHFMMASEALFFPAMAVIACGNGLFLPNLPSQVKPLYAANDVRLAGAYNLYYMGINLGAFLAPLVCGTLGELYGWHYGFGAAGVGMCLGLAVYILGSRHLAPADAVDEVVSEPDAAAASRHRLPFLAGTALAVVVFRVAYAQTGNTLALWADTAVDRHVFGWTIPATWVQLLNPLYVFVMTPLLVAFWNRRGDAHAQAAPLWKMAIGAMTVAASFVLLAAVSRASDAGGAPAHWLWLVVFFALLTLGELYILPVGLGLFAQLALPGFGATTIAAWFLAAFAGNLLSGVVGTWWTHMSPGGFFLAMAAIAALASVLLTLLAAAERRYFTGLMTAQRVGSPS